MKVHHIGYLVKNIDKAVEQFLLLGYQVVSLVDIYGVGVKIRDDGRKIDIVFMKSGNYLVELVSPVSTDSVVAELLKRVKNSPYHICYESENLDDDIAVLKANGFTQIDEPCAAPAIAGRRVVFFASSKIGLIELLEI